MSTYAWVESGGNTRGVWGVSNTCLTKAISIPQTVILCVTTRRGCQTHRGKSRASDRPVQDLGLFLLSKNKREKSQRASHQKLVSRQDPLLTTSIGSARHVGVLTNPQHIKSTSDLEGQYGKNLLMFDLVVWRLTPLDKTASKILNKTSSQSSRLGSRAPIGSLFFFSYLDFGIPISIYRGNKKKLNFYDLC